MDKFKLNPETLKNGIYILSEVNDEFESSYIKVRSKERRIYPDDELLNLPFASETNPHRKEWKLRAKSYIRFTKYLKTKKERLDILDLGCGNAWFCGQLSKSFEHNYYCIDINKTELEQGRKVFNSELIRFIYADIFTVKLPEEVFDLIIINAAVQYFPDLKKLLNRLLTLIADDGEIHIIDSPVYSEDEAGKAKLRTQDYYLTLGLPEMTNKYYHHTWDEFRGYNYELLYDPFPFINKLKKLLINDSPFPWIRIIK